MKVNNNKITPAHQRLSSLLRGTSRRRVVDEDIKQVATKQFREIGKISISRTSTHRR